MIIEGGTKHNNIRQNGSFIPAKGWFISRYLESCLITPIKYYV